MSSETVIHVIDDDDAVRDSLVFLLESTHHSVKAYASAAAFLDSLPAQGQGCVITDVRMPGLDGMELLRQLRDGGNELAVIVITGHGDIPLAVEAMKLGAVDFLEKPFDDKTLLASVSTALRGREERASLDARNSEIKARLKGLSARERQVLEGLIVGCPNKVIAFDLGISPRTVEVYRANLMTKMQAKSLSELVRMTIQVA